MTPFGETFSHRCWHHHPWLVSPGLNDGFTLGQLGSPAPKRLRAVRNLDSIRLRQEFHDNLDRHESLLLTLRPQTERRNESPAYGAEPAVLAEAVNSSRSVSDT